MISLRSNLTKKLIYFFAVLSPDAQPHVNHLARKLGVDPKNLHRNLVKLEQAGLLKSEFIGQQRHFSLRENSPLVAHYRGLLLNDLGA